MWPLSSYFHSHSGSLSHCVPVALVPLSSTHTHSLSHSPPPSISSKHAAFTAVLDRPAPEGLLQASARTRRAAAGFSVSSGRIASTCVCVIVCVFLRTCLCVCMYVFVCVCMRVCLWGGGGWSAAEGTKTWRARQLAVGEEGRWRTLERSVPTPAASTARALLSIPPSLGHSLCHQTPALLQITPSQQL